MQRPSRESKKNQTRAALIETAARLFRRDGFDRTTVDQIASGAGVSRRTFFRYFPTKEAVVFPNTTARIERFRELLGQRDPGESAFDVVRRACLDLAREFFIHHEELVLQHRLVQASPALLAYDRDKDRRWEAVLAEGLLGPEPTSAADQRRARILAGAAMGAIQAALEEWYATGGRADLVRLGEEALSLLERGFQQSTASVRAGRPGLAVKETL
jgi:AcrR family transcriptional regulator